MKPPAEKPNSLKSAAANSAGRIIVAIPTVGRGSIVAPVVRHLATQTRWPDLVVVSGAETADLGDLRDDELPFPVTLVLGPRGSCPQRNRVFDLLQPADVVLFIDDDYLLAPDHLAQLERIFAHHPEIAITTGSVLADGVLGPGLSYEQGLVALAEGLKTPAATAIEPTRNGYGCNMAVRMATVLAHDLHFDENLPLYAWFEDVDFSLRAAQHGRVVKCGALRGVHLGTKTGRTPGKKLGYSQVANLVYIARKGVLPARTALKNIARNFIANSVRSIFPVAFADHRGRLIGNLIALGDLVRGRIDPQRITRL